MTDEDKKAEEAMSRLIASVPKSEMTDEDKKDIEDLCRKLAQRICLAANEQSEIQVWHCDGILIDQSKMLYNILKSSDT